MNIPKLQGKAREIYCQNRSLKLCRAASLIARN